MLRHSVQEEYIHKAISCKERGKESRIYTGKYAEREALSNDVQKARRLQRGTQTKKAKVSK